MRVHTRKAYQEEKDQDAKGRQQFDKSQLVLRGVLVSLVLFSTKQWNILQ